jgi:hypothetical protein
VQRLVLAVLVCVGIWTAADLAERLVAGPVAPAAIEQADIELPSPGDGAWQASPDAVTVLAAGASWISPGVHATLAGAARYRDAVTVPVSHPYAAHRPLGPPHLRDIPLLI